MTTALMCPCATQALGDHGADVIKVESRDGEGIQILAEPNA
jgi:crotonobetainyl-CoA:carnitine CoA-transferase CaiB-like acyl-CoA transferase